MPLKVTLASPFRCNFSNCLVYSFCCPCLWCMALFKTCCDCDECCKPCHNCYCCTFQGSVHVKTLKIDDVWFAQRNDDFMCDEGCGACLCTWCLCGMPVCCSKCCVPSIRLHPDEVSFAMQKSGEIWVEKSIFNPNVPFVNREEIMHPTFSVSSSVPVQMVMVDTHPGTDKNT